MTRYFSLCSLSFLHFIDEEMSCVGKKLAQGLTAGEVVELELEQNFIWFRSLCF